MAQGLHGSISRQKILDTAAELFAKKGFTETTIRELSEAVGFKNSASIYHHFPSKGAVLQQILEDYSEFNINVFDNRDIRGILRKRPTADGVLECLQTSFPSDRAGYYINILCVMLQEQLRNPIVRTYVSEQIILRSEHHTEVIIGILKSLGVIRQDTDPDYWKKVVSSLFYSFASRMMMGIGDSGTDFTGLGMSGLLKRTYEIMFEKSSC
ncbi:MAG: TetR/AcrR family transcriptional regulator [Oscillospiraceae bacterium]|nr:TetR/AcrR family transcriptional regulator [Oscillospiraceae bacterium]